MYIRVSFTRISHEDCASDFSCDKIEIAKDMLTLPVWHDPLLAKYTHL